MYFMYNDYVICDVSMSWKVTDLSDNLFAKRINENAPKNVLNDQRITPWNYV